MANAILECEKFETHMKTKTKSKNIPIDCPIAGCKGKLLKDLRAHICRTHKDISLEARKTLMTNIFPPKGKKGIITSTSLQSLEEELEMEDGNENAQVSQLEDVPNEVSHSGSKNNVSSKSKPLKRHLSDSDIEGTKPMKRMKKTIRGLKRKGEKLVGIKKKKATKQQENMENTGEERMHSRNTQFVSSDKTYDLLGTLLPSMTCPSTSSKGKVDVENGDVLRDPLTHKDGTNGKEQLVSKGNGVSHNDPISNDIERISTENEREFFELLSTLDLPDIEELCGEDEMTKSCDVNDSRGSSTFPNVMDIYNDGDNKRVTPDLDVTPDTTVSESYEITKSRIDHIADTPKDTKDVDNDEDTLVTSVAHSDAPLVETPETLDNTKSDTALDAERVESIHFPAIQPSALMLMQQTLKDTRNYTLERLSEFPTEVSSQSQLVGSGLEVPLLQKYLPDLALSFGRTLDMNRFTMMRKIWVQLTEAMTELLHLQHMDGAQYLLALLCDSMFQWRQCTMRRVLAMLRITGMSSSHKNLMSLGCPHLFGPDFLDFVLKGFIGAKAVQTRLRCDKQLIRSVMKTAAESWSRVVVADNGDEKRMTHKILRWICAGVPRDHLVAASDWLGGQCHTNVEGKTFIKVKRFAETLARCLDVAGTMVSTGKVDEKDSLIGKCLKHLGIACVLCEKNCDGNIRFNVQSLDK